MPIIKCPICNKRIHYNRFNVDIEHSCGIGNDTVDYIDTDLFCPSEYNGTSSRHGLDVSVPNTLKGTDAGVVGAKEYDLTDRGNIAALCKQRRRNILLELR